MPMLRSAMIKALLNGMHTNAAMKPITTTKGASLKSGASAAYGTMSSFISSLMPSASHCRMPCGPTRFGPMRD
jgi:hypothetical protein